MGVLLTAARATTTEFAGAATAVAAAVGPIELAHSDAAVAIARVARAVGGVVALEVLALRAQLVADRDVRQQLGAGGRGGGCRAEPERQNAHRYRHRGDGHERGSSSTEARS